MNFFDIADTVRYQRDVLDISSFHASSSSALSTVSQLHKKDEKIEKSNSFTGIFASDLKKTTAISNLVVLPNRKVCSFGYVCVC